MAPRLHWCTVIRDLGDGLVLRRATTADADALTEFNADYLRFQDAPEPSRVMAAWTRDLMTGRHPTFRPESATVVEDTRRRLIVSSIMLIRQTWAFGGVPIGIAQPELIATHPDYRGRGVVRAQLETVHQWSAERGDLVLIISGIPGYYRQFGYELALQQGGGPVIHTSSLPRPDPDEPRPFRVRELREGDLAFLTRTYAEATRDSLVTVLRDEPLWRYEWQGRSAHAAVRQEIRVIETTAGEPVGFLTHQPRVNGTVFEVTEWKVARSVSWRAVWPTLLAYCWRAGEEYAQRDGGTLGTLSFWYLGDSHPIDQIARLAWPRRRWAYYVRVPDLPAFVRAVAPALERRLAASLLVGHTGELTLGFYRPEGVRLVFERGRLVTAEAWRPDFGLGSLEVGFPTTDPRRPVAMFPGLTFLQLLFGFRALDELQSAFPDCIVRNPDARALVTALFPRQPSDVWPVL